MSRPLRLEFEGAFRQSRGKYVRIFNKRYKRVGHLFLGHYKSDFGPLILSATLSRVRKWWVGLLGGLLPAALVAASPSWKTITPELRASLTADYAIDVVVTP